MLRLQVGLSGFARPRKAENQEGGILLASDLRRPGWGSPRQICQS